jgi:hypothetical protein
MFLQNKGKKNKDDQAKKDLQHKYSTTQSHYNTNIAQHNLITTQI